MSRAFVKEDPDPPERTGRRRAPSGLPPGAENYLTDDGARWLREKIVAARDAAERAEIEAVLASATIVAPPAEPPLGATFGARVTLRLESGAEESHRILGVDELDREPGAVSWVSPLGRALLGARVGGKIALPGEGAHTAVVVAIAPPGA